jgi:hypothetical protein
MVGCRDTEIRVYEVPKEKPSVVTTRGSEQPDQDLKWTKPDWWTEKTDTSFRLASYTAGDEGSVDVSVTAFPDRAGGLLANINRWRGQIELEPVDEKELQDLVTEIMIADHPGWFVDLVGPANDREPSRIIGAIVSIGGKTWFFKMTGPADRVESELAAFRELAASARTREPQIPEDIQ